MNTDVPEKYHSFMIAVAGYEDLKAGYEPDRGMVVETKAHDGEDSISFDKIAAVAWEHDLYVVGGVSVFPDGLVEVVVADDGWKSGEDE